MNYVLSATFFAATTPSIMACMQAQCTADKTHPAASNIHGNKSLHVAALPDLSPPRYVTKTIMADKQDPMTNAKVQNIKTVCSPEYCGTASPGWSLSGSVVSTKCATNTSRHLGQQTDWPSKVAATVFFAPHFGQRSNFFSSIPSVLPQLSTRVNGGG